MMLGQEATLNWTPIVLAVVSGVFSIIALFVNATISRYLNNKRDREIANNALNNALGAVQQAIENRLAQHPLQIQLPQGTPPEIAAGVQSAINNAGPEMDRLGITITAIANKLIDRWNLRAVENPNTMNKTINAPMAKPMSLKG